MMLHQQPASALLGFGSDRPRVEQVGSPEVCQARANDQDFVVIKYTGRFADGTVFDDRYSMQPLIYELGSFYLPVRLRAHERPRSHQLRTLPRVQRRSEPQCVRCAGCG
tara:strand:- start:1285 stop:1611 length:327 start_codon:yes stop_codon:yes gene_type:complete